MRFVWWEALALFVLWLVQFVFSGLEAPPPSAMAQANQFSLWAANLIGSTAERVESFAHLVKVVMTYVYFLWAAFELALVAAGRRSLAAFTTFPKLVRENW
jgi:hypothetical protein